MDIQLTDIQQCPLCRNTYNKFIFNAYDVQFSKTLMSFPVVKCLNCGLIYLKERPTQDCIENFYPKESYPTYLKDLNIEIWTFQDKIRKQIKNRLKRRKNQFYDRILLKLVPSYWKVAASFPLNSKILDIGCGAGWKLDRYKEFGWITHGLDISSEAIEVAKTKGHHVFVGQIEDINFPNNYFDAIQLSHVIEHLPNPVFAIEKIHGLLKEKGVLLLETPNQSGLISKIFCENFWQIDSPRHFQLFNISNLCHILKKIGFKIEKIITNNSPNGVLNSIQAFVTKRYGKEKNVKNNLFFKMINSILMCLINTLNKLNFGENIIIFASKQN